MPLLLTLRRVRFGCELVRGGGAREARAAFLERDFNSDWEEIPFLC